LEGVSNYGQNDYVGLLINSSRGIIYAGDGEGFAEKARQKALDLQEQMGEIVNLIVG